ncbi:MAG: CMP/dCMP deaminase zinc-binding protein [Chitinophagaceae bacterium]|nr:CMP/dCMP deaminase zinc-binding protein [Chitinophagaceae bacterium]
MNHQKYQFEFEVYDSSDNLNDDDKKLLMQARKVTENAYAPYSNFFVGAVAKLENGEQVTGTNQENASYPVGMCAERVLLAGASSLFPKVPVQTIAISYHNNNGESNRPVSPCGMCRQALLEYEERVKHPIRLILGGLEGKIYVIPRASMLLPLSFTALDME